MKEVPLIESTLSILKPDATKRNLIGKIIARLEDEGLEVAAMRMTHLSRQEAEGFYAEHSQRPFFGELVEMMTAGHVVLMVLRGENAVLKYREIMGATNPAQAAEGTLRKLYAIDLGQNTVHGSDSLKSAEREINYFFPSSQIYS